MRHLHHIPTIFCKEEQRRQQDGKVRSEDCISYFRLVIKEANEETVTFRIHLRQCNLDVLEEKFWQVSDPDSIHYGKYMTVEEINSLVSCNGDVEQVQSWLRKFGITNAQVISNSIKVRSISPVVNNL